jgi:tetratricopeptide (TPR) repeat protein
MFSPALYSAAPDAAATYYDEGKKLQDQGQYEKAVKNYKQAIKSQKDYADAFFAMGVTYYKMNRPADAIKAFKEVLRINPASSETYNNLAVIYAQQGDYESATKQLKETIRLDPAYYQGRLNLADLYLAQSIQEYIKVIRSQDSDNKAVRDKLRRLLLSDVQNPEFQYHLGILNRLEGNDDEAVKNLRNTVRLDPGYASRVHLELGEYFEAAGKPDQALQEYGSLLKTDPNNYWAAYNSGRIKNNLKEYAAAKKLLLSARETNSTAEVNFELGQAWEGLGRTDEAIASYEMSLKQKEEPEIHFRMGQAFKKKKDYAAALKEFETILETYPDKAKVQKEIMEVTNLRLAAATPVPKAKTEPPKTTGTQPDRTADTSKQPEGKTLTIPAALVGLERQGDHALVVDKSAQTLLLYQKKQDKVLHVKSFACSTGKNNGQKLKMGDKRTPEGIYLFTEVKHDAELLPEYGKMAFPMDYPNLIDQREGKDGNGIWLHSTNEPLRSYLPQKTRGCVVVNDKDIEELARVIKLYETPIVIYDSVSYVSQTAQENRRREILDLLSQWEDRWEAKDVEGFVGFYASSFKNGKMNLAAWRKYKRGVFKRAKKIHVELTPYQIVNHNNYAVVTFLQEYRTDRYSDTGIKRLFLIQENNEWRIVGEEWRSA